jgi:hypothetical protein
MAIFIKILSGALLLFSLFMGVKHGLGMATAKPEMLEMFGKWDIGKTGVMILGTIGLVATLMLLFPPTYIWGNLITAAVILLIIGKALDEGDLKTAFIEVPFMLIPLLMIYLKHPLAGGGFW